MPTVEFNTSELKRLISKEREYNTAELKERIPMIGVGLDHIDDGKITVEVFPNRPDMLSIEGFARALRGFFSVETGLQDFRVDDSGIKFIVDSHAVKDVRPFVVAAVIRNVSLSDERLKSIMDIQEKLHLTHGRNRVKVAIGVHNLDVLSPPFKYTAVRPDSTCFVPLDMSTPLSLREILEKHPKGRDYAFILEKHDKYPLIIDGKNNVLSFPPIINGELTRVTTDTRNLFIEITGTDQLSVNQALNIVSTSISEQGGSIQSVELQFFNK